VACRMSIISWRILAMNRDRAVSIVTGCVHLVLRLDRVRLRRGDQLGFGLANLQLLELCRGLGPICGA